MKRWMTGLTVIIVAVTALYAYFAYGQWCGIETSNRIAMTANHPAIVIGTVTISGASSTRLVSVPYSNNGVWTARNLRFANPEVQLRHFAWTRIPASNLDCSPANEDIRPMNHGDGYEYQILISLPANNNRV